MLDGLACGLRLRRTTDPSSELQHVTALAPAADRSASVPNGDIAFSRRARPIRHRRQLEPASDGESRPALRLREWLRLYVLAPYRRRRGGPRHFRYHVRCAWQT